jgi:hypothetical protein
VTQQTTERPAAQGVDFGPDQGSITAFNLRPMQVAIAFAGIGVLWAAAMTNRLPLMAAVGLLVTLPCVLAAVLRVPLTGKYLDQMVGPWVRWRWRRLTGANRRQPITSAHWLGDRLEEPEQAPPSEIKQIRLEHYTDPHGRQVGLVYDRWQRTYTVVLRIEAGRPGLGGHDQLDQTLRGWERVLRGVAEPGSGIRRFQWLLVAAPDDGTRLVGDFHARAHVQTGDLAEAYEALARDAGPTNTTHETYLAVQVDERPARDEDWVSGSAFTASAAHALAAARKVAHKLASTSFVVVREALAPGELGRLVRLVYCPQQRADVARSHDQQVPLQFAWPKQIGRPWENVITDGAMHRVYELAWPEQPVAFNFLDHLTSLPGTAHALSVVYQPLDRPTEIQKGEQRRSTAEVTDERRRRWGFLKPRRKEQQEDKNEGYIGELLAGHEPFRVTAWAAVSAFVGPGDMENPSNYVPVRDELVFSSSRAVRHRMDAGELALKTAAADARVTLIPRDGVHAQALAHVLPFCMGTEGAWL